MKKSTKQVVIVVVIILIFGMSTIAFVATSITGGNQQQITPLQNPIVEGDLDPIYESTYVQNGFTWLKFYYTNNDPELMSFIESLPQAYATNTGQTQLIVQKINNEYNGKQQYVIISSPQGYEEIENPDEMKIVDSLCKLLTITPVECIFNFNITTNSNITVE